jgi:predicted house-cleaning noncanonical NTP pyrophosphatase (MazG superfamily)
MKRNYFPTLQERRFARSFSHYNTDIPERIEKLQEEVDELRAEPNDITELSDVLAVVVHIARIQDVTIEQLLEMAIEKTERRQA